MNFPGRAAASVLAAIAVGLCARQAADAKADAMDSPYFFYVVQASFAGVPLKILRPPVYGVEVRNVKYPAGMQPYDSPPRIDFSPLPPGPGMPGAGPIDLELLPARAGALGRLTVSIKLLRGQVVLEQWARKLDVIAKGASTDSLVRMWKDSLTSKSPGDPTQVGVLFGARTPEEMAAAESWFAWRRGEHYGNKPVAPQALQLTSLPLGGEATFTAEISSAEPVRIELFGDGLRATAVAF